MRENQMDPEGMSLTQAGWVCGIIAPYSARSAACLAGYIGLIFTVVSAAKNAPRRNFKAHPCRSSRRRR